MQHRINIVAEIIRMPFVQLHVYHNSRIDKNRVVTFLLKN